MIMASVKTELYLRAEHRSFLKEEAAKKGISLAELLQQIVDAYVDSSIEYPHSREDYLKIVALGRSGRRIISEEHDRYIADTLRAKHVR
jgi:hypothetical protein